ncbi:MAG: hypothetical protein OXT73_10380 [Bacteroidota bacterium]|nr:hypothetical protein [Bacteroidota bacterium]
MKRLLLLAIPLLLTASPASSQNLGVALRAGTTGLGVQAGYGLHSRINLRINYSAFALSQTRIEKGDPDLEIQADAGVGAISGFVDVHPFATSFRLTVGLGQNALDVDAVATPLEGVCLGDQSDNGPCDGKEFSAERVGKLTGKVSYASGMHPYIGMGFGNLGTGQGLITFLFDLGAYFTGSPSIEMDGQGLIRPTAESDNVQVLNDGIESFTWYPVVSLGIGIRL